MLAQRNSRSVSHVVRATSSHSDGLVTKPVNACTHRVVPSILAHVIVNTLIYKIHHPGGTGLFKITLMLFDAMRYILGDAAPPANAHTAAWVLALATVDAG